MDITELRIGNVVQVIGGGIIKLELPDLVRAYHYPDEYVGVPITDELLNDSKFKKITDDNDDEFRIWRRGFVEICDYEDGMYEYNETAFTFIHYHTLQNLYFGVTGAEL